MTWFARNLQEAIFFYNKFNTRNNFEEMSGANVFQ
jgi:hypothetical protein